MDLAKFGTPFDALKTAEQQVQFGIDPSRGLTRERYHWWSNGTQFDNTNVSGGDGEIDLTTTATGTDTTRFRSALAGQYVSQSLAKPGIKFFIDPSQTSLDSDNYASISHGSIKIGPFTYDGTQVINGYGLELASDGIYAFWKAGGNHKGDSPIKQDNWEHDQLNGGGNSGIRYDPANGYVYNFPYTWYNAGRLGLALLSPEDNTIVPFHSFDPPRDDPGRASLYTPNLPVQCVIKNGGTAQAHTTAIGGMQYSLYGAASGQEVRDSYVGERGVSVGTAASSPLDPTTEPGEPLLAVRREPNADTIRQRFAQIDIDPDSDIYLYIWDSYDDSSALTGASFEEPFSNNSTETRARVDTSSSAFTLGNSVFRKVIPVDGGSGSKSENIRDSEVDERIPLGATRIVTVVGQTSTNVTLNYTAKFLEGF